VSEGQTWRSEDTRVFSFKVFLVPARRLHCLTLLRTALTAAAFSEAECIVFAAEGLLLAHDVHAIGVAGDNAEVVGD
jgi:hypothetical protein